MSSFSNNSFFNQVASAREGELFRHPQKGFATRIGEWVAFLNSRDPSAARHEAIEFLALELDERWGGRPTNWSRFHNMKRIG